MDDTISLGLLLPVGKAQWGEGTDPRELVGFAVAAEQAGYDSLWVNDSLLSPRIEALTMLAAIAPATSRVTIGTAALMPVLRRPVQAAQALASIDLLSGGRLDGGGRGGLPRPARPAAARPVGGAVGRPVRAAGRDRGALASALDRRRALVVPRPGAPLRRDPAGHACRIGRAGRPSGSAAPRPRRWTAPARLYDGWLPYPPDPADYAAGLAQVRQAAAESGREADAITPALFASVLIADDAAGGRAGA